MPPYPPLLYSIRQEIQDIADGKSSKEDNPLINAPHTMQSIMVDEWNHSYSREQAAFPLPFLRRQKFWPTTGRVDDVHGRLSVSEPVSGWSGQVFFSSHERAH
jgi:glycine dehydrogenase